MGESSKGNAITQEKAFAPFLKRELKEVCANCEQSGCDSTTGQTVLKDRAIRVRSEPGIVRVKGSIVYYLIVNSQQPLSYYSS